MTLHALLRQQSKVLPPLEARMLLAHVLGKPRAWLAAHPESEVGADTAERFRILCARRAAGEPVAYLIGHREFYGLDLECSPAALIPRPETELLVDLAIAQLAACPEPEVLELGTGTGAIALALATHCPGARITATDISIDALALAARNAARLGIATVHFVRAPWYEGLPQQRWNLIVSNPPYIAPNDKHLAEGDLRFEPRHALSPEGDGLDALRIIIGGALPRLQGGGALMAEHGWDQGAAVRDLFAAAGFADIATAHDLAGQERVTRGSKASQDKVCEEVFQG